MAHEQPTSTPTSTSIGKAGRAEAETRGVEATWSFGQQRKGTSRPDEHPRLACPGVVQPARLWISGNTDTVWLALVGGWRPTVLPRADPNSYAGGRKCIENMTFCKAALTLSVILSTYRSPKWLEKVLWGYLCQSRRDFELVVADDGSGEATARVIRAYADRSVPVRHVWQRDDGFRKSRILNRAIEAARGDYLLFSDGDCIPRRDFVAVHRALAAKGRFLSGGYVKLSRGVSRAITREDVESGRCFAVRWIRSRGEGGYRRMAKLAVPGWAAAAADRITTTRPTWNGHNASGWRSDLVAANGFDERMGYGGQDRELGERLENAGISGHGIRYRALCVHLDHDRGYADLDTIMHNKAIRRETRTRGITRTPFGIEMSGGTAGSAPRPPDTP